MYRNNTKKDFLFYEAIRFPSRSRKEEQNNNPTRHSRSYAHGMYLKKRTDDIFCAIYLADFLRERMFCGVFLVDFSSLNLTSSPIFLSKASP